MSKSLNLFIPAIGGTALVLGLAYGFSSRQYVASKTESYESRIVQAQAEASQANAAAAAAADRATALEQKIAEVKTAAAARPATGSSQSAPAPTADAPYGLGRPALKEEIAAWDVNVLPDGTGLPEGSGDVSTGEGVFSDRCSACHGDFAEGSGKWPVLAGGMGTLADKDPVKTVGSYWPYLSTTWDYIHRSMPFGEAGTLSADDTYAIVAYLLYSNDLVDEDFVLSRDDFTDVKMPNAGGFVVDDRPEREYPEWSAEPCMQNCKDKVDVTMRTIFLVETPEEGGTVSVPYHATTDGLPTFTADGPSFIPEATPVATPAQEDAAAETAAPVDDGAALVAAGEKLFRRCSSCHQVGPSARNRTGPELNGVVGRPIGSVDGFRYSSVFAQAADAGRVWDEESLDAFLTDPKAYFAGTRMSFRGFRKEKDRKAVIAYLKSFGG